MGGGEYRIDYKLIGLLRMSMDVMRPGMCCVEGKIMPLQAEGLQGRQYRTVPFDRRTIGRKSQANVQYSAHESIL